MCPREQLAGSAADSGGCDHFLIELSIDDGFDDELAALVAANRRRFEVLLDAGGSVPAPAIVRLQKVDPEQFAPDDEPGPAGRSWPRPSP